MTVDMEGMAVAMPEVLGHPNRAAFQGVLTTVDVPSQKAPSGARGHLVVLTKRAAEAALPSLLGMALDYSPTWDRHDVRRKVGVITQADIVGRNLEVSGYLYARDFPEIVEEITKSGDAKGTMYRTPREQGRMTASFHAAGGRPSGWAEGYRLRSSLRSAASEILCAAARMRRGGRSSSIEISCPTIRAEARMTTASTPGLGLSYEVTDVRLADESAQVWMLEKVTFTGAAILRRDKAAYRDTWIGLCK
jgi:hypothetical protein